MYFSQIVNRHPRVALHLDFRAARRGIPRGQAHGDVNASAAQTRPEQPYSHL
jgi:hypothetical protein